MIDKIVKILEQQMEVIKNIPDQCNSEGYGDGESLFADGMKRGKYETIYNAIQIVKQVAEETQCPQEGCKRCDRYNKRLKEYEETGLPPDVCKEYKIFEDFIISRGLTFTRMMEIIDEYLEAEHKGGWIKCSDELPKHHGRVLVTYCADATIESETLVGVKSCGAWYVGGYPVNDDFVLAWRELPMPYKEG